MTQSSWKPPIQGSNFGLWRTASFSGARITKTKEMVTDFRRSSSSPSALQVDGQTIDRVEEYKYVGSIIDHKLTSQNNTDRIFKKCHHLHSVMLLQAAMAASQKVNSPIIVQLLHSVHPYLQHPGMVWLSE